MTTTEQAPQQRLGGNYWRLWSASVATNLGDGIAIIAYPWLASAVTRSPMLIALIAVAQRIPWLVFTLPAGVITDRLDRRKIIVAMDVLRGLLTFAVAGAVVAATPRLPSVADLVAGAEIPTNVSLYLVLLAASLLFGMAEVLRDNSAQTFLPAIVDKSRLERANANLWGAEMVANSFVGPPLGSLLLGVGFALPFLVNGGVLAVAGALVFLIAGDFRARRRTSGEAVARTGWVCSESRRWLWNDAVVSSRHGARL